MTVMNLLYGADPLSPNHEPDVHPPIKVMGAHRSRLHDAMICFYVGQIMDMPLEQRESTILFAPIVPDLKLRFLECLEFISRRCSEIKDQFSGPIGRKRVVGNKEMLAYFKEMKSRNVQHFFTPIIDHSFKQRRNSMNYNDYVQLMQDNSEHGIPLALLRNWLWCNLTTPENYQAFSQNIIGISKISIKLKLEEQSALALAEGIKQSRDLKRIIVEHSLSLKMGNCELITMILNSLKQNTSLVSLNIPVNYIGDWGAIALAEVLKVHPSLATLKFWNNQFTQKGVQAIAEALKENTVLTKLRIAYNDIGNLGVFWLAEALKVNQFLLVLDLRSTKFNDEGASYIAAALRENRTLVSLKLGHNLIGPQGGIHLAEALKQNLSLKTLNLWDNRIGDTGAAAFADMMKVNCLLTCLVLMYNRIRDEGAAQLQEVKDLYPERRIEFC